MFTNEDIRAYFTKEGIIRHPSQAAKVAYYDSLRFHVDGFDPFKVSSGLQPKNRYFNLLIGERRPGEDETSFEYRKSIYKPITAGTVGRFISFWQKILRAEDWITQYPTPKSTARRQDIEVLKDYMVNGVPIFKSFDNWLFGTATKWWAKDPHCAIIVLDLWPSGEVSDRFNPGITIIPSSDVVDINEKNTIVQAPSTVVVQDSGGNSVKIQPFWLIDQDEFIEIVYLPYTAEIKVIRRFTHGLGYNPGFMPGGDYNKMIENRPIYFSPIEPMTPKLDEAAREYSDNQAEVVLHVHSQFWSVEGQDCTTCNGSGWVTEGDNGVQAVCKDCNGTGALPMNQYQVITFPRPSNTDPGFTLPGAGYIEKDKEMVKVQTTRIDDHLYDALAAVNAEHLHETPLNQSGKAKEVDHDAVHTTLTGIATHVVNCIAKPATKRIVDLMFGMELTEDQRLEIMPIQPIPERFDVYGSNDLVKQIEEAKKAGVDPSIVREMQKQLADKRYAAQPEVRARVNTTLLLNPFDNMSTTEIVELELNGSLSNRDVVLSSYLPYFIEQAQLLEPQFLRKSPEEQMKLITPMLEEKLKELEPVQAPEIERVEINADDE